MPTGIVVMHWDARIGAEMIGAYPEETVIQDKTMMQLVSQHEFTGEAGFATMTVGSMNLASYYTGEDTAIYITLLLTGEEEPDQFEDALVDSAAQILKNIENSVLPSILPGLFHRISVFPTMTEEQRLSVFFNSDVKRMILQRLREDVIVPKSEFSIWLKDQRKDGFVEIDSTLNDFVKQGLIKMLSVQGYASDVLCLVQDLMMLRVPPVELVKDPVEHHLPESLKNAYVQEVRTFFESYRPDMNDNLKIIAEVLLESQPYEILKLMREAIVTKNDLMKLAKKGVTDLDTALKALWQNKLIAVFKDDKNVEYYCLLGDPQITKFYPRYLLDIIRDQYRKKAQNSKALVGALDTLKTEYVDLKTKKTKSKEKKKDAATVQE